MKLLSVVGMRSRGNPGGRAATVGLAMVGCLTMGSGVSALADTAPTPEDPTTAILTSGNVATSTTTTTTDPDCTPTADVSCTVSVDITTTAFQHSNAVTPDVARLKSADGTTLAAAAASGNLYSRTFSESMRGAYYYNWVERHSGKVYWDGSHVWVTSSYRGAAGYHNCDQGSGIGYSIVVTNCADYNGVSTNYDQEWDYFQVHVVFKAVPIYRSYNMHVNAHVDGTLVFYG
jgi:hypothetical protein